MAATRRNAMRLSHLVADLLFTATATSGAQVIDPSRVTLATIMAEAVEAARPDAKPGGVVLEVGVPETLTAVVDGMRLRQVADNLIANAIRYTFADIFARTPHPAPLRAPENSLTNQGPLA